MTSSSSRGVRFYFLCAALATAVVGAAANALVLYALVASKQHRKHALIFNQNLLDFANCFFLVISNVAKLDGQIYLSGTLGYWVCMLVLSELFAWAPFIGSIINLAAITVERYLKIVHAVWAKQKLRKWVIYVAVSLAWITGFVVAVASSFPTTRIATGKCYIMVFFSSEAAQLGYWIWYVLSFYFAILFIFIFCYGRILMEILLQQAITNG